MFTNKKLKTHKNRPVLGLNHRDADAASVTTNHRGVDVGSVYRNNTKDIHPKSVSYFVANVKCGLYEINKNNRQISTHGLSPVQKCSEIKPKRYWTGEVQDQDLNLYYH